MEVREVVCTIAESDEDGRDRVFGKNVMVEGWASGEINKVGD